MLLPTDFRDLVTEKSVAKFLFSSSVLCIYLDELMVHYIGEILLMSMFGVCTLYLGNCFIGFWFEEAWKWLSLVTGECQMTGDCQSQLANSRH